MLKSYHHTLFALVLAFAFTIFQVTPNEALAQQDETAASAPSEADLLEALSSFKAGLSSQDLQQGLPALPFEASGSIDNENLRAGFALKPAPGAYVYQESLKVEAELGGIKKRLPGGTGARSVEHRDLQGTHLVYFDELTYVVDLKNLLKVFPELDETKTVSLTFAYQGCSEDGICYPPQTVSIPLEGSLIPVLIRESSALEDPAAPQNRGTLTEVEVVDVAKEASYTPLASELTQNLSRNLLWGMAVCFLLGIGLNLTPCVLPMLPIFSAMIVGGKDKSLVQIVLKNACYALGLVATYTMTGLIFSTLGAKAQAFLQHPVSLMAIALLLFLCALSCADVLKGGLSSKFSAFIQSKFSFKASQSYAQAVLLGIMSALVATPCTSAPLAGAIIYTAEQGDLLKGSATFAAIGLGMATPLFIIGVSGRNLFKKAGRVSILIKKFMAIPLFGAAVYLLRPLISDEYSVYAVFAAAWVMHFYLGAIVIAEFSKADGTGKTVYYTLCALASLALASGAAYVSKPYEYQDPFETLAKVSDLEDYRGQKPLLIDFTAAWCTNCKVMEKTVFSQDWMADLCTDDYKCVKFDLTDMQSQESAEIIERFKIIGIPYLLILDGSLNPLRQSIGLIDAEEFKRFAGL